MTAKRKPLQKTERLLTSKEVADKLHMWPSRVCKLAIEGRIPALKVGTSWRFRESTILEFMENEAEKAVADNAEKQKAKKDALDTAKKS